MKMNVLESIVHPDDVEWKKLANDVLAGNLVYPV